MREREIWAAALISLLLASSLPGAPSPATNLSEANKFDPLHLVPDLSGASKLDQQIQELIKAGRYSEAIPLATQSLHRREETLGSNDPKIAQSLDNLGQLYVRIGDYAKAEPLFQRALNIREKALGPEHPDTARSLNNLAQLYMSMGNYAEAEPLFQRSLKICEKVFGQEHPNTATTINSLAGLYQAMDDYTKAEPFYQRAIKIREKTLGPENPGTAQSLDNLAVLYQVKGDYAKAEPLHQRALRIREKALGQEHPGTAASLHSLGLLYERMGDYAKAEPLFQRALKICEKALGPEHADTATSLRTLGWLYVDMSSYDEAIPLLQRALKIDEKTLGPNHPGTALSLNNLGHAYEGLRDYGKAAPLFQRALEIYEKVLGPKHRRTAANLDSLANIYIKQDKYAEAEPLHKRAVTIIEEIFGPENPMTAGYIGNLAWLYVRMGEYAKAEPLYRRTFNICEKSLGPEHPDTVRALFNLAYLYAAKGDSKEALHLAMQARQAKEKNLSEMLSFTSEQQRLAFQKASSPYDLPATLGNAPEIAEIVLRQKGVVLDSLLEDQLVAETSGGAKQREIINRLRSAKQRLMQLQLEVPTNWSKQVEKQQADEKENLSEEVKQLEGGLARQFAGLGKARRALSVTLVQVQSALPQQTALIEFLRYSHYLGKGDEEPRYGAVVVGPSSEPKWVPLGAAGRIEKSIQLYQKAARGKTDEGTLSGALHELQKEVWAPIEQVLTSGTKTIIISPDAELSFVSFATLIGPDDKFLAEKYSIRYVASGRDLLRQSKPSNSRMTFVYANPDFESKPVASASTSAGATTIAMRSLEMRDLESLYLRPLLGTEAEADALEKRGGKSVKAFIGPKATEAELRQVNAPRVLHLATHGFFLPEIELGKSVDPLQPDPETPKAKLVNPMHRSGLALAGAQTTLEAWARGEVPPTENDGIVTAEEVGGLKLDGTWLVVLSACDTGSGEARAGEGVMGLRRGFIQAGAQNLLMTLWPISDEMTVQIMLDFYNAAEKIKNAPQALADVQRDWLVKLRKERGLLDAFRLAGPFIMSSQGKQ